MGEVSQDILSRKGWKVLITGARSLLGQRIAAALMDEDVAVVRLLDIQDTPAPKVEAFQGKVEIFRGDILNEEVLGEAAAGVDTVFHIASYGMSGAEGLQNDLIERVNVQGTNAVIRTCRKHGVQRLIYTSTYNVVFGGDPSNEIVDGDESYSYLPPEAHCDAYSRTKGIAEQQVLSNGGSHEWKKGLEDQQDVKGHLYACAVRPAAIYGEGEWRHFGRIVKLIKQGAYAFIIGKKTSRQDWVHIENLVDAHLRAASMLVRSDGAPGPSVGQAYFINDGESRNTFEFMRPLVMALGQRFPTVSIPYPLMMRVGHAFELAYHIFGLTPMLTRCEVNKCARHHTFSITKARKELGFEPVVKIDDGMRRMVVWLMEQDKKHGSPRAGRHWKVGFSLLVLMSILALLLYRRGSK
mmetsp:Transcript_37029/g.71766  ORF Transcript_37029/g.71766 Transcript_37029/m.71766 type:complete len:410 (-) Transcript_37029:156-1385(-)